MPEVNVKAGQTIVLEIKTTGQSEAPGKGNFEVSLIDVDENPTAPQSKVYLVSEIGSKTYEVDINTDKLRPDYGTGKLDGIEAGKYTLSLEPPPPPPPPGNDSKPVKWAENIYFAEGETNVSKAGNLEIEKIAKNLTEEEQSNVVSVMCTGYADNRGNRVKNGNLSIARGASVRKQLKIKLDANMVVSTRPKPKIESKGKGSLTGTTEEEWKENRRVEFWVQREVKASAHNIPATVLIYPSEFNSGKLTNILKLSATIGFLYEDLIKSDSNITIRSIRNFVFFSKYPPKVDKNGNIGWTSIHGDAIAVLPSFSEIKMYQTLWFSEYSEKVPVEQVKSQDWGVSILLSGSVPSTVINKVTKSKILQFFLKFLKKSKIALSLAYGKLIRDKDENNSYDGVFVGVGIGFGLSTPGAAVYSTPTYFKTEQMISIDNFDWMDASFYVAGIGDGEGAASAAFISFLDDKVGENGRLLNVSGSNSMVGLEVGGFVGLWFNL